jgi:hypothetical protein
MDGFPAADVFLTSELDEQSPFLHRQSMNNNMQARLEERIIIFLHLARFQLTTSRIPFPCIPMISTRESSFKYFRSFDTKTSMLRPLK